MVRCRAMDQILGQTSATAQLQAALAADRLAHAFIFHGPAGVGKFTTALIFGKLLLCHAPATDLAGQTIACDACPSCRLFRGTDAQITSAHPDLHVLTKELAATSSVAELRRRKQLNIPVDLVREHIVGGTTMDGKFHDAPAYQSSKMNHGKVFIIDEAELLAAEGQNAMLKTLEEPPKATHLFLITSSEDKLLPTIRSRCQRVAFAPLADQIVDNWLETKAGVADASQRQALVTFASGSLGRAKLAIDWDLGEWGRTLLGAVDAIAAGRVEASLGSDIASRVGDFAEAWVKAHDGASKEAANHRAAGLMWSMIANHARRQLAAAADDPTRLEGWLAVIDALRTTESELASHVNLSLVCDHLASLMHRAFEGEAVAR